MPTARAARLVVLLGLTVGFAGCEREPARSSATAATRPAVLGPRDTLVELVHLRNRQGYEALPAHVVPDRGRALADTLLAIDDFLAANRRLGTWLETHADLGVAQTVDQSYLSEDLGVYLGGSLGIFSRDVEFLDEVVNGGTASVSFLVAGRLPAQRARLVQHDGRWLYDPQTALPAGLTDAFRDMAHGLDELHSELAAGQIDAATIRRDPDAFVDNVQARLRRGVRLLSEATMQRGSDAATRAAPGSPP